MKSLCESSLSGIGAFLAPELGLGPVLPSRRVQFWQTENSWRLDRSYRGRRRRVIPRMVDAARFRSLIDEFPSPS